MRLLVTGGSGYLGTHVRNFFQADDFSRRSQLDILNPLDTAQVSNYDAVIHLAAYSSKNPADAESCFRTNVEGTVNLLQQVRPGAVFIFASTKDVYGSHADRYEEVPETCSTEFSSQTALEWSKLIAERYVEYYATHRGFR
ncbi:MAG TPA: NAD(P)-dependent oxidoreductase, partial [Candidatus Udaeobacter sp.]|nr:NAD(P)-dependent oxidoreductase [Candidatus Udaeobacter sp.]